MKAKLICVFAHPDDEAFGPGGTIAQFSQTRDVYILCTTKGEAGGFNQDKNIASVREKELIDSAKILGVKEVKFLGFRDGKLSNSNYHAVAKKIKSYLEKIRPDTLLTFEPRGVSGHLDHVAVSMVTSYLFEHLKFVKKLLYYCHLDWQVKIIKTFLKDYFVYFPPGYKSTEINLTVNIGSVWKIKERAMKVHLSQIHDVRRILAFQKLMPKKEYFMTLDK